MTCKKQVTIGRSGLTMRDLMLRLKRLLIAGLDDSDWGGDRRRTLHVSLGEKFLYEFAEGLSEEACDMIANREAPPRS